MMMAVLLQKHLHTVWSNWSASLECWASTLFECQESMKPKIRVKSCY